MVFISLVVLALLAGVLSHTKNEWKGKVIYQLLTDRFNNPKGGSCDLSKYCGGTFQGVIDKLDYIQDMGFNAIWISPVVENTDNGYHGYWAKDINKINSHFGSSSDLKKLVSECHKRGIWVMVDVVANHMGYCSDRYDYSCFSPFNDAKYYHDNDCDINNWNNQSEVENCRLSGLPDLKQEDDYVANTLYDWVKNLVKDYDFDGIRVDTIQEVPKWFWSNFVAESGVYSLGECMNGDINYVSDYQNYLDGVLSYPIYYKIGDVFGRGKSAWNISNMIDSMKQKFKDIELLGTFVDNHDNARWLSQFGNDHVRFKNALTFAVTFTGVPIVYYGSEQGFNGGNDPNNREALWPSGFDTSNELYQHIRTIVRMRTHNYNNWGTASFSERYVKDDLYCFSRGDVFVTLSNYGKDHSSKTWTINNTPYKNGTTVCNIFWPNDDCVTVGSDGSFKLTINNGESKIWVPQSDVNNYIN